MVSQVNQVDASIRGTAPKGTERQRPRNMLVCMVAVVTRREATLAVARHATQRWSMLLVALLKLG
jgi:hypothetical protein